MCSNQPGSPTPAATPAALAAAAGELSATGLTELLHGVLDHLLATDLTALGSDELAVLTSGLVRAGHRQGAAVLDAVAAFDSADVASTSRHRTAKRWLEHRTHLSPGAAGHLSGRPGRCATTCRPRETRWRVGRCRLSTCRRSRRS